MTNHKPDAVWPPPLPPHYGHPHGRDMDRVCDAVAESLTKELPDTIELGEN